MDAIVTQMIILFILVIVGYVLSKLNIMDADFDRKLSSLVIEDQRKNLRDSLG